MTPNASEMMEMPVQVRRAVMLLSFMLFAGPGLAEAGSWHRWISDVAFLFLDVMALYWLFSGTGAKWFSERNAGAF